MRSGREYPRAALLTVLPILPNCAASAPASLAALLSGADCCARRADLAWPEFRVAAATAVVSSFKLRRIWRVDHAATMPVLKRQTTREETSMLPLTRWTTASGSSCHSSARSRPAPTSLKQALVSWRRSSVP